MVKNISSTQKSIKTMLRASSSDTWNLGRTILYCKYLDKGIIENGSILDDYADYFDQKLVQVQVPEEYFYSPSLFSEYYYGTPDLDFLILYFAKITTLFEFNRKKIYVLPPEYLREINQLMIYKKKEVEASYSNPIEYVEEDEIESKTRVSR